MNADFHINRGKVISGTDMAGILGLSPWTKPIDVWRQKKGLVPPIPDNEHMYMGRKLEPVIASIYEDITGRELMEVEFQRHPVYNIGGHPDRVCRGMERGVEIKTTANNFKNQWGEPGTDEVPAYYLTQVITYMGLLNYPVFDVVVSIGGQKPIIYTVQRNKSIEDELFQQAQHWWDKHIVGDIPPDVDESESYSDYLKSKFPRNRTELLQGSDEVNKSILSLIALKDEQKQIEEQIKLHENLIKASIGDAEGVVTGAGKCTWKNNKDGEKTDWQLVAHELWNLFKSEAPEWEPVYLELLTKYTKLVPGARVFRFTHVK